jgi:hypothetical protein
MGLISKIYSWGVSPLNDESTINQWAAGLVLVLILTFFWIMVNRELGE